MSFINILNCLPILDFYQNFILISIEGNVILREIDKSKTGLS